MLLRNKDMKRPHLNEVKGFAIKDIFAPGQMVVTMSPGQWDEFLELAYNKFALLVELDDNEIPTKGFRKQVA
jgi:hypothetical protein